MVHTRPPPTQLSRKTIGGDVTLCLTQAPGPLVHHPSDSDRMWTKALLDWVTYKLHRRHISTTDESDPENLSPRQVLGRFPSIAQCHLRAA